jgi:hypothetical protein
MKNILIFANDIETARHFLRTHVKYVSQPTDLIGSTPSNSNVVIVDKLIDPHPTIKSFLQKAKIIDKK